MKKAIFMLLLIGFLGCTPDTEELGPVLLRVKNGSSVTIQEVQINSNGAEAVFGQLQPGEISDYLRMPHLYSLSLIHVKADTLDLALVPFDYVGERALEAGKYTYTLFILKDDLSYSVQKDK